MAICPSKSMANSTAGISMSASFPSSIPKNKAPPSTILRSRGMDTSSQRGYSSEVAAAAVQESIGEEVEAKREKEALVAPDHMDAAEKDIFDVLNGELSPTRLVVNDISGGCGSMYYIEISSERFRGLGMLKQQRLVNEVLGERVKEWHGVQMKTSLP